MAINKTEVVASSASTSFLVEGINANSQTLKSFLTTKYNQYDVVALFECDKNDLFELGRDYLKNIRKPFAVIINDGESWNLESTLKKNPSIESSQYQYFIVKS